MFLQKKKSAQLKGAGALYHLNSPAKQGSFPPITAGTGGPRPLDSAPRLGSDLFPNAPSQLQRGSLSLGKALSSSSPRLIYTTAPLFGKENPSIEGRSYLFCESERKEGSIDSRKLSSSPSLPRSASAFSVAAFLASSTPERAVSLLTRA